MGEWLIDPASLRIDYAPYDEPVRVGWYMGDPIFHHGRIRVEWDSPTGPYVVMWSSAAAPADFDEMRPLFAEVVRQSYDLNEKLAA